MSMTHAEAERIVEALKLVGPAHGTVHGDFDRVRAALEAGPEVIEALNTLDPARMEETPQGAAAHLGCREILEHMLARGVELDLFMACALGWTDEVAGWLERQPGLANARGAHGIHILNHAFDPRTARLLLDHGADPEAPIYPPWGWTPIHEAAAKGRLAIVEVLLARCRRVRALGSGTTPLHAAARWGHRAVVEHLLIRGANLAAQGVGGPWEGKTALEIAAEYGHAEIAELLHAHRVRWIASQCWGWALHAMPGRSG
jgi:ankyrin repeat protein